MARMVPSELHPSCTSPGEREIFRRLRDDPNTKEWIVLHSLDLSDHPRQVTGEADFVVIVPGKGVLCLEIKAHRHIRCAPDGLWYFGREGKGTPRSPFKQAAEARFAIHKALIGRRPDLSRVVFWSAVILPYVELNKRSVEWHPWQVIDSRRFRSRPISSLLLEVINQARKQLKDSGTAAWFFEQSLEPYPEQCAAIADTLRPSFECNESPKARAERLNTELKQYTEEQFNALDAMETNLRVAFTGPAGSGKTLLALEAARRSAATGRRVLLLCFNKLLSRWLEEQVAPLAPGVCVRTLHGHMQSFVKVKPSGDSSFWDAELPTLATDRLLDVQTEDQLFDELIIDEAQDILRQNYLDFLDLCVKGGLAAGRWRLFGDFEKQNLYSAANVSLDDFLKTRGSQAPRYHLRVNCRNTPRIAGMAEMLGGLQPGYKRCLRPDDRVEPEVHYYRDGNQQQSLLVEVLERLYAAGYAGRDITVLSTRSHVDSAAYLCKEQPWADRLKLWESASPGHIGHCSIHAFKGLEAGVVVVTDVTRIIAEADQELLYVAATRALHRLVILAQDGFQEDFRAALVQRIEV